MTEEYWLYGQCKSGKNAMQVTRFGHHYAKPAFKQWRDDWTRQILQQRGLKKPISSTVKASVLYWPGDLRRRDAPGIQDALWHLLEYANVLTDDKLITTVIYEQQELDRKNPRVFMILSGLAKPQDGL